MFHIKIIEKSSSTTLEVQVNVNPKQFSAIHVRIANHRTLPALKSLHTFASAILHPPTPAPLPTPPPPSVLCSYLPHHGTCLSNLLLKTTFPLTKRPDVCSSLPRGGKCIPCSHGTIADFQCSTSRRQWQHRGRDIDDDFDDDFDCSSCHTSSSKKHFNCKQCVQPSRRVANADHLRRPWDFS